MNEDAKNEASWGDVEAMREGARFVADAAATAGRVVGGRRRRRRATVLESEKARPRRRW